MELIHTKKSSATKVKSHHSNVLSYTHVHKNRLDAVAEVNVAKTATFTGKIETSARFLAMRFACKAAGVLATQNKSIFQTHLHKHTSSEMDLTQ